MSERCFGLQALFYSWYPEAAAPGRLVHIDYVIERHTIWTISLPAQNESDDFLHPNRVLWRVFVTTGHVERGFIFMSRTKQINIYK